MEFGNNRNDESTDTSTVTFDDNNQVPADFIDHVVDNEKAYSEDAWQHNSVPKKKATTKWYSKHNLQPEQAQQIPGYVREFIYPDLKFCEDSQFYFNSEPMVACFTLINAKSDVEKLRLEKGVRSIITRTIQVKRNYSISRCQMYIEGNIMIWLLF